MAQNNLEEYKLAVQEYASKGIDYLFHNNGNEHAQIVFQTLFDNARSMVRIAAGSLCNDELVNTKEYIDSVTKFLDIPNAKLYILLSSFPEEAVDMSGDCLLKSIATHRAVKEGRVIIKDGKNKGFKNSVGVPVHFCTADSRMYRLETDIVKRSASCNFGDSRLTKQLELVFDEAFKQTIDTIDLLQKFNVA